MASLKKGSNSCRERWLISSEEITSPTYTYYNKYEDNYHFDLYRVNTVEELLDFGIEEVRIPDQNINLKLPIADWDWAKNHTDSRIQLLWTIGKLAEVDNVVKFQKGKWDCSDAGMILYWITGANVNHGLKAGGPDVVKKILLDYVAKNPQKPRGPKKKKK